jgi:hypothetical protein
MIALPAGRPHRLGSPPVGTRSLLLVCLALAAAAWPAGARADAPTCAATTDAAAHPASSGSPCWVDVQPYPFGADGNPVDTSSGLCKPPPFGPQYADDVSVAGGLPPRCYLQVESLAFRAWNRGLAATSGSTAFGLWLFNGTRWYPDPTFPGGNVCKGNTVLWAGKLDYWLIGQLRSQSSTWPVDATQGTPAWPQLCRFDGADEEWQPLDVPRATLNHVPLDPVSGLMRGGAMTSGSCYAWNDCWFFGSYGVVVHWDGTALSDATPDTGSQPWLAGDALDAVARIDTTGNPFGLVVTSTGGSQKGQQVPPGPDDTAPPQLRGSTGGAFSPLPFSPPTAPQSGDPYRTDLVAVDADPDGRGWVAGDPVGFRPVFGGSFPTPGVTARAITGTEPSPLTPIGPGGGGLDCPTVASNRFQFTNQLRQIDTYLWSSLSVFGGGDQVLAGGQLHRAAAGGGKGPDDDGSAEAVIVQASCDAAPSITRFTMKDPEVANQATAPTVPATRKGAITSVAANANNDAWAATSRGWLLQPGGSSTDAPIGRPHLYRWTDGTPPNAPAGDDSESRPPVFQLDPPIFVEAPPEPEPPAPPPTVTQQVKKKTKRVRLKAAVYSIRSKTANGKGGTVILTVRFRVRRRITIGLQALRHGKVVATTGLKHFKPKRGKLVLKLDRKHWPTKLRFIQPKSGSKSVAAPPAEATRR